MPDNFKQYVNEIRKITCRVHRRSFVVAGMPRCGTTLMCTALTRRKITYYRAQKFMINLDCQTPYLGGMIYKTHDPTPPLSLPGNVKVIYVFGDPRDAVISIHKNLNFKRACLNAKSNNHASLEKIFEIDIMRLEENFDNWHRPQSFRFASVRYDAIYNEHTINMLQEFTGMKLNFPPKVLRESKYEKHSRLTDLEAAYGRLANKVFDVPSVQVWDAQ